MFQSQRDAGRRIGLAQRETNFIFGCDFQMRIHVGNRRRRCCCRRCRHADDDSLLVLLLLFAAAVAVIAAVGDLLLVGHGFDGS
jgi:hypothetical protein